MDKKTITQALALLKYTYPTTFKDFKDEDMEMMIIVWQKDFANDDPKIFMTAIDRLRMKNKWCPSIAEVKQEIALISNPVLQLKADEEWEKVRMAVRKYGYYRSKEAMSSLNPVTARVVRMLGGWESICQNTNGDWLRKNFIESFNTKTENYEEAALLGEPQLTLAEIKRLAEIKSQEIEHKETLLIGSE